MAYSKNDKPTIELISKDAKGNETMRLEVCADNPESIDRIRKKVARVLIEEWSSLEYEGVQSPEELTPKPVDLVMPAGGENNQ